MHVLHTLLPNPAGDAQDYLRRMVFGPKQTPGAPATGGGAPTGPAGGGLSGTYPNPDVVPDVAGLVLAGRAFGRRTLPPSGAAGGDLGGVYPAPTVLQAQPGFTVGGVAAIVEGDVRLTNARTPTGTAGGDLSGTYPNPTVKPDNAALMLAARSFLPHVNLTQPVVAAASPQEAIERGWFGV